MKIEHFISERTLIILRFFMKV